MVQRSQKKGENMSSTGTVIKKTRSEVKKKKKEKKKKKKKKKKKTRSTIKNEGKFLTGIHVYTFQLVITAGTSIRT